jgi:STE24 endopeptidase
LANRVTALLKRCGFEAGGLFVMDGSRRSSHGNAYFSGIGRNKRIVLFDTLLARLSPDEVEAVLAHELGHFRLGHVYWRLGATLFGSLGLFAILGWLAAWPAFYTGLGIPEPSPHAALLLFVLALPVLVFWAGPALAAWFRKHEYEADRFAAAHANGAALAQALIKLHRDNAATLTPDRLYAGFYDSHPALIERIRALPRARVPLNASRKTVSSAPAE